MWRGIRGYKDYYRINEDGVVQSKSSGKWKPIKRVLNGDRICVGLVTAEGLQRRPSVARLVFETFVRKLDREEIVFHKDRDKWNCGVWNLQPMKPGGISKEVKGHRRAVQKVDKHGNVVCIYSSITEASEKEFICRPAIVARCKNRLQDPFEPTGYTYQYDELRPGERRMKFAK